MTYWLARLKDPLKKITISDEHQGFTWLGLAEARELAPRHAPVFDKFNEAAMNFMQVQSAGLAVFRQVREN